MLRSLCILSSVCVTVSAGKRHLIFLCELRISSQYNIIIYSVLYTNIIYPCLLKTARASAFLYLYFKIVMINFDMDHRKFGGVKFAQIALKLELTHMYYNTFESR